MPYSNIDKPSKYFNTVLYNGNGSTQSITGVGFQPDCTWTKGRTGTYGISNHKIYDSIRGATKTLFINLTNAETTQTDTLTSFNSDGFSLGSDTNINASSTTFVSWNWLASNTTGSSNTSGTITSTVAVNTTAGFSIVSYTGNGTAGATIGHGLGAVPKMMIVKSRGSASAWRIYHASLGNTQGISFDTAVPSANVIFWNNTSPTSTLFTVGTGSTVNSNTVNYIAYCFAEIKGYSKFGSYTGNNNADGTFVYTGFRPRFVLIKRTDVADDWIIFDSVRNTSNVANLHLYPDLSNAETTGVSGILDILSNGFKSRGNATLINASGTYIYMALAENPFVSSKGIPCTAR